MKKINKISDSKIITNNLNYPKDSKKIREILEKEQNNFCAYTEYKITAGFSDDVEHFNPTIKNTIDDGYSNWFAVSHKWNRTKDIKWNDYQPVLNPTSIDLEERILYDKNTGVYYCKIDDIQANNLKNLIDLNNPKLVEERKNQIERFFDLFEKCNDNSFVENWIKSNKLICFHRTIEETFNIKLS